MSTFNQSEHVGELITALAKAQAEFTRAIKIQTTRFPMIEICGLGGKYL